MTTVDSVSAATASDANIVTIRTTHTGSLPPALPQQARLEDLLAARIRGEHVDPTELAELSDEAVDDAVRWQQEIGVDVVSGGEADRAGFMDTSRFAGWGIGPDMSRFRPRDLAEAGMLDWLLTESGAVLPRMNAGPVRHDPDLVEAETDRLLRALRRHGIAPSSAFLPEPSPGVMANLGSTYYDDQEKFLNDITGALRQEYQAIARAGLILQVDAPDLLMDWFCWHPEQNTDEYLVRLRRAIRAINDATEGIPREQLRVHVCHGNWAGPHNHDVDLPQVIKELYRLRAGTLVIALANRRHRWEREIFREPGYELPEGVTLAAGVVEPVNQCVEHEETIAAELMEIAGVVGPGRVIATTDCGFRTCLGLAQTRLIGELKLRSLVAGARLASERLSQASRHVGEAGG